MPVLIKKVVGSTTPAPASVAVQPNPVTATFSATTNNAKHLGHGQVTIAATGTRQRSTMSDLPAGSRVLFKTNFLPVYLDFLGSRSRPFDTSEARLAVEQQLIWDTYLLDFTPVDITPRSAIYNLVCLSFHTRGIY